MWFLQSPSLPYPRVSRGDYLEIASSPGAAGVFRTDPSQRVLAFSGRVTTEEGSRKQRHYLTFVVRSSALTSLALGEREGTTIKWEKWQGKVTTLDRSSHLSEVRVEGSRVFILEDQTYPRGKVRFTVYDFSPGAHKEQNSLPYASQRIKLTRSDGLPQSSWEVSGDSSVLFDVSDLNFIHTCLVSKSTPGTYGPPGNCAALHRHCLVPLNPRRVMGFIFRSSQFLCSHCCRRIIPMYHPTPTLGYHRKRDISHRLTGNQGQPQVIRGHMILADNSSVVDVIVMGGAGKVQMYESKGLLCKVESTCKPFNDLFWGLWMLFSEYLGKRRRAA